MKQNYSDRYRSRYLSLCCRRHSVLGNEEIYRSEAAPKDGIYIHIYSLAFENFTRHSEKSLRMSWSTPVNWQNHALLTPRPLLKNGKLDSESWESRPSGLDLAAKPLLFPLRLFRNENMRFCTRPWVILLKAAPLTKTVCKRFPPGPMAPRVRSPCLTPPLSHSSPTLFKSGDQLRLPGLAGHLRTALCYDRWSGRGLTVQTQTTDQMLQCRTSGPPFLSGFFQVTGIQFDLWPWSESCDGQTEVILPDLWFNQSPLLWFRYVRCTFTFS